MVELRIYKCIDGEQTDELRCRVEKWQVTDSFMGENFLTFSLESPVPVDFTIGDWCEFRGETYYLNYLPSCTQEGHAGDGGKAFQYQNVKMNTAADELARCEFLDVVLTSGAHVASEGTNYTGSSTFSLYCHSVEVVYEQETIFFCPAHVLLDKILANLVRLYGTTDGEPYDGTNSKWKIFIDDSKCLTKTCVISASNWTVAQALSEVHNSFVMDDGSGKHLDYIIRGRNIIVGDVSDLVEDYPELGPITGYLTDINGDGHIYNYGYGRGVNNIENDGKGLFSIVRTTNMDSLLVTRLRAQGSTKNLPYMYYNKRYGLPQTMFVTNLQLPQTFLPVTGEPAARLPEDEPFKNKTEGNQHRASIYPGIREVKGEENDAYIDKDDDAENCPEGIREASAIWDGSNGDLPEIYPTISKAIYSELRMSGVKDMNGYTEGTNHFKNYDDPERIDLVLAPGEGCNYGDGRTSEKDVTKDNLESRPVNLIADHTHEWLYTSGWRTESNELFTTEKVYKGKVVLSFTLQRPIIRFKAYDSLAHEVSEKPFVMQYRLRIYQIPVNGDPITEVAKFTSDNYQLKQNEQVDIFLQGSDADNGTWVDINGIPINGIPISLESNIKCELEVRYKRSNATIHDSFTAQWSLLGYDTQEQHDMSIAPNYQTDYSLDEISYETQFKMLIKDTGIDWDHVEQTGDEEVMITMNSGYCGGRSFKVNLSDSKPERTTYTRNNKVVSCWELTLEKAKDDSIYAYFPSEVNPIYTDDEYVITGILLPDAYIKYAEVRLLVAATEYLLDNQEVKYTYQPKLDELYLQRDLDMNEAEGTPEKSIFYRLRSGMRFTFKNIPEDNEGGELSLADITIEQVQINMGESPVPKVEIKLNDELTESTQEKIRVTVDRIYGSLFGTGGISSGASMPALMQLLRSEGTKLFLRKDIDDKAAGTITFDQDIDVKGNETITGNSVHNGQSIHNGQTEHNALALFNQDFNLKNDQVGRVFGQLEFKAPVSGQNEPNQVCGLISWNGNARFTQVVVTGSMGATPYDTNTDLNGVTEISEVYGEKPESQDVRFVDGYQGKGFGIWMDENNRWHLTTDNLTVRQQMKVFELIIQKIRSTGGTIVVSCANGKIKEAIQNVDTSWKLTFETDVDFAVGDIIRCQVSKGFGILNNSYENRSWTGQVVAIQGSGVDKYIIATITGSNPVAGDEVVQWGSNTNTARQNIIYITAAEGDNPAIDMMSGVTSVGNGTHKVRIGKLNGINTGITGFTPSGWGLYSDNAYLKGKLVINYNNEEKDVSQLFSVADGKFESVISGTRAKLTGDSIIYNQAFTEGANCFDGWSYVGVTGSVTLSEGSQILSDGEDILSSSADADKYVAVIRTEDDLTHFIRIWDLVGNDPTIGIQQNVSRMRDVDGTKPKTVGFKFQYRIDATTGATLEIGFLSQKRINDPRGSYYINGDCSSENDESELYGLRGSLVADGEWHEATYYGTYVGSTGSLTIKAVGKIDMTDFCLMEAEDVQFLSTSIEQTNELVAINATAIGEAQTNISNLQIQADSIDATVSSITTDPWTNLLEIQESDLVLQADFASLFSQRATAENLVNAQDLSTAIQTNLANYYDKTASDGRYATPSDVTTAVNGVYTSSEMAALFSGYVKEDNGEFYVDAQVVTLVTYNATTHEIEGNVLLTGDKIILNGYIDANGLKIDEEGNVTTYGVVNNGRLVLTGGEGGNLSDYIYGDGLLDVLRCPPTLMIETNSLQTLRLPCVYYDSGLVPYGYTKFVHNHDGDTPTDGWYQMNLSDFRSMVGKKIDVYWGASVNPSSGVNSHLLVEASGYEVDNDGSAMVGDSAVSAVTKIWRCVPTDYTGTIGAGHDSFLTIECKLGVWDGHECIYWEAVVSAESLIEP